MNHWNGSKACASPSSHSAILPQIAHGKRISRPFRSNHMKNVNCIVSAGRDFLCACGYTLSPISAAFNALCSHFSLVKEISDIIMVCSNSCIFLRASYKQRLNSSIPFLVLSCWIGWHLMQSHALLFRWQASTQHTLGGKCNVNQNQNESRLNIDVTLRYVHSCQALFPFNECAFHF